MKDNIKIHGLLVEAIAQALSDIFVSGRYADKVIEYYLKKNRKWGSRDRKFFAESVYEVLRWWRFLWWLKGQDHGEIDIAKRSGHRSGDGAPYSTRTSEPRGDSNQHGEKQNNGDGVPFSEGSSLDQKSLTSLWAHWWIWIKERNNSEFSSSQVSPYLTKMEWDKLQVRLNTTGVPPAIAASIPDWLFERGKVEFGDSLWIQTLKTLNEPALVYLRVNTLKVTAEKLIAHLKEEGIETQSVPNFLASVNSKVGTEPPETLVLAERKNVFTTKVFKLGFFEIQDWSSQQVASMLDVAPGMRVIDACAGAGGKTLHLAALMKNKGKILALDIHEWKLKELRTRASRNGVDIIEVKMIEGQKTIKRLEASADRVLLDVPCSGLGVLRRNPDSKWKLTAEELKRLSQLQQEILSSYARMAKVGGKLVYSTCSIFPSENEQQVRVFLEKNPEFTLIKQKTFMPQDYNSDGFYMAQLERKA